MGRWPSRTVENNMFGFWLSYVAEFAVHLMSYILNFYTLLEVSPTHLAVIGRVAWGFIFQLSHR